MNPFMISLGVIGACVMTAAGTYAYVNTPAKAAAKAPEQPPRYHFSIVCPGLVLYESISQEKPTLPAQPLASVQLNRTRQEYLLANNCRATLDDAMAFPGATSDLSVYLPQPPKVAAKSKEK